MFKQHDEFFEPFQQLYNGPYKVIRHTDKHFAIDVNGQGVVSLDRLKPVHVDHPEPNKSTATAATETAPNHSMEPIYPVSKMVSPTLPIQRSTAWKRNTSSGCHIHWPKRLTY